MTSHTTSPPSTVLRPVGDLRLLTWPALDASGADAVVTARSGGVSSGPYESLNLSLSVGDDPGCVRENRRRLATAFGVTPDDFVFARQVHGAGVRVVGDADRGSGAFSLDDAAGSAGSTGDADRASDAGGADALVTTSPGVVLAILTADCVPIVLHDPVAAVLACVHAGWRGTVAGVTTAALAAMQAFGSRPSDVIAGVGPAIAAARYQVGADVHQAVTQAFGPAAAAFIRPDANPDARPDVDPDAHPDARPDVDPDAAPESPNRWLLDLWAANHHALVEAGVPAPQIHTTTLPTGPTPPTTTAAGPGYFFSDRSARPCGRLALVARLRAPGQKPMDVTLS
jgi:polyphenol oxidase